MTESNTHRVAGAASRHVLARHNWGSPECYAALVIFAGLADALGLAHRPFIEGRRIDRQSVAFAFLEIRERDGAAITAAATELWAELFGRPLPQLTAR